MLAMSTYNGLIENHVVQINVNVNVTPRTRREETLNNRGLRQASAFDEALFARRQLSTIG